MVQFAGLRSGTLTTGFDPLLWMEQDFQRWRQGLQDIIQSFCQQARSTPEFD
jgi:hypothetical protein